MAPDVFWVSGLGPGSFLVKYQAEMMCDLPLSRDSLCDLGALKKKGMIISLTLLVCWDDKSL
jgi:hypothetical protein